MILAIIGTASYALLGAILTAAWDFEYDDKGKQAPFGDIPGIAVGMFWPLVMALYIPGRMLAAVHDKTLKIMRSREEQKCLPEAKVIK